MNITSPVDLFAQHAGLLEDVFREGRETPLVRHVHQLTARELGLGLLTPQTPHKPHTSFVSRHNAHHIIYILYMLFMLYINVYIQTHAHAHAHTHTFVYYIYTYNIIPTILAHTQTTPKAFRIAERPCGEPQQRPLHPSA